jgi:hypothetical protein
MAEMEETEVFGRALLIIVLVFTVRFMLTKWLRGGPTDTQKKAFEVAEDGGAFALLEKDKEDRIKLPLKSRQKVSPDSYLFTYELPADMTFGVGVGGHCRFHVNVGGEELKRKFTPISAVT